MKTTTSCISSSCSQNDGTRVLRNSAEPVDWNLYIFCQKSHQHQCLVSVMTKNTRYQIMEDAILDYKVAFA